MSEKIPADIMAAANATVESIFTDLRDRRFLKWLFDERGEECFIDTFKDGEELRGLDHFVQDEIKAAWAEIIVRSILAERKRCVSAYMHWARAMEAEANQMREVSISHRIRANALEEALKTVLASLVATTSLIIRAEDLKVKPSKAVASDKMFTQMLKDYDKATIAGRAALKGDS